MVLRWLELAQGAAGGERLHLANRNRIEPFEPAALRQGHVDKLRVHSFNVGQHEQLLDGGVVAHVAFELGVGVAPLLRSLTEERDVEEVGLVGVRDGGLRGRDLGRDEMGLHRVGVDAVVELGEGAVEVPSEGEAAVFVVLEPLEFLDQVELEFRAKPRAELEGNVLVGVGATVAAGAGRQTFGAGVLDPRLGGQEETVPTGLVSNSLEFEGIKTGVVNLLLDVKEEDGVLVFEPLLDQDTATLEILHHVGERDIIAVFRGQDGDVRALDFDGGFLELSHRLQCGWRLILIPSNSMGLESGWFMRRVPR